MTRLKTFLKIIFEEMFGRERKGGDDYYGRHGGKSMGGKLNPRRGVILNNYYFITFHRTSADGTTVARSGCRFATRCPFIPVAASQIYWHRPRTRIT